MIKTVRLVRRDPGLTPEQFKWRWLTRHGAVLRQAVEVSPICRVTASFLTPEQITTYSPGNQLPRETDFDGIEQLYFRTGADLRQVLGSGLLEELTADEAGLSDNGPEAGRVVMLEEVMAVRPETEDAGVHRLKTIRTIARKKGLDMYQFRDHWHNHHKIIELGGIRSGSSYRINVSFSQRQTIRISLPDGKLTVDEGDTDYDAFMDIYALLGSDIPAQYASRPFPAEVRRDETNFINFDAPLYRNIMDEYVVGNRVVEP
jgi:hypothetical protein